MNILLIPSCGLSGPGQLDYATRCRCEAGLKLWRNEHYHKIVVSGSVSELMSKWLEKEGVPEKAIIIENESVDTFTNVSFTLHKLRDNEIKKFNIGVVTHWQQVIRFLITFRSYGVDVTLHPLFYKVPFTYWLKEWFFILYHWYDWRGEKYFARRNRAKRLKKRSIPV